MSVGSESRSANIFLLTSTDEVPETYLPAYGKDFWLPPLLLRLQREHRAADDETRCSDNLRCPVEDLP